MDLIFFEVQPDFLPGQNGVLADRIWMSPSGDICAVIDGVSGCADPVAAAEACVEYLDAQDVRRIKAETAGVLQELNRFLANRSYQAVIGIVHIANNHVWCMWVGNPRLFSFFPDGHIIPRIDPVESQPLAVLGQVPPILPCTTAFDLADDEIVLLTTDGIDHQKLQKQFRGVLEAKLYKQWQALGTACQAEDDWSFVVFPIEKRFSYGRGDWPYNPFTGPQESHEHERRGLATIASELFRHPEFDGFRIVGGVTFPNANATRRLDGILVSPLGVVLLELKDHDGEIRLPLTNRQPMQIFKGEIFSESNPVSKVIEVMPTFERFNLGEDIDLPLRKIGAVIFTNPQASVCCMAADGIVHALPVKSGDIFIVTPAQLAWQLKAFVRDIKGKRNRRPLEGKLDRIVSALLSPATSFHGGQSQKESDDWHVRRGYRIHRQPLKDESTGYYQVFKGQKPGSGISVWLKEYKLSQVSRDSREAEAERIGRESMALEKLNFSDVSGIQKSLGYFHDDESLFVVLNEAPELRLGDWLTSQPDRTLRLALLIRLAELLGDVAANGIVHRSVNPANIRINQKQQPVLINFELCRMETVQTLPITGRQNLNNAFIPREANNPGCKITPAADVYSLGKIIILVLSGKLPFPTYQEQPMVEKKPGFWSAIAKNCGLIDSAADQLASMLSTNPAKRPTASQVKEILQTWN